MSYYFIKEFVNLLKVIVFIFVGMVLLSVQAVIAVQSEKPFTTAKRYNLNGQVTGTIHPDPDGSGSLKYQAARNIYNTNSQLIIIEKGELGVWKNENVSPSNWSSFTIISSTTFTYNARGLVDSISEKDKFGTTVNFTQINYDTHGRVNCEAARLNSAAFNNLSYNACSATYSPEYGYDRITKYDYDNIGQVTKVYKAYGTSLQQVYRENTYDSVKRGMLKNVYDANGNRTQYEYDAYARLEYIYYPAGGGYSKYEYDTNGNLTRERKRNGSIFTYSYDRNNRMRSKTPIGSQPVVYSYDLRGLQLSAKFSYSGEGITNTYDSVGNLKSTTISMGTQANNRTRTLSFNYDLNGNLVRVTYPDNAYFNYAFDGNDRLSQISNSAGSQLIRYTYSQNGRRASEIRNNGTGGTTAYSYGAIGRLEALALDFAATANDHSYSYTYNPVNQISSVGFSNNSFRYTQNANVVGNYTVNNLNQYTNIAGKVIGYDDNGNLTSDGVSLTSYTYDNENRLLSSAGSSKNATFIYDPLGRLYEATINGNKKQFLYHGDKLVAEYNAAGTLTERYVHGVSVDEPLVQFSGTGTAVSAATFLHRDHQGSIVAHSNHQGTLTQRLTYDAYGIPATTNNGRFQYTGQLAFKELGLYYYKARIYNPKLGRFLQTDPIGYEDQMNLYTYVHNDPLNYVDPTGEASKVAWLIKLTASGMRKVGRLTHQQAVSARRNGDNILGDRQQISRQIEISAHGKEDLLRHRGHKLSDGSVGKPHFQTDEKRGHSFWSIATAALLGTADSLDKFAEAVEVVDPTSYLTSGGSYKDSEGNAVSFDQLMNSIKNNSSNSENGMSGSTIKICSGMGTQRTGC